jgi:hypothetical protein
MPPRLVLLLGLLALTGCRNKNEGAVKLTVSYSGFKPGCLRVSVRDAEGAGEERKTEFLPSKGDVTGGTVTVAAFREAGWSNSLTVKAEAFEKACATESPPVATDTRTVTVDKDQIAEETLALAASDGDGDGYVSSSNPGGSDCDDAELTVHPGAQELCNDRDDNCDEQQDEESFELGDLCDAPDGCKGTWACGSQGARTCMIKKDQWHPDGDKDGDGARGPGLTSCKQPDGYVANELDCDDTNPRRNTKALESCNDVDDNCDGKKDEGLGLGNDCTGLAGCMGQLACATDGGTRCNSPTPTVLYPDNDQDTRGAADAGVTSCEPTRAGHVDNANDCDDTRAHVYVGAPEICDGLDNDCDETRDESFNVDGGCTGLGCTGVTACAADGGTQCNYVTQPSTYYPDDDLDQYGKQDAGVLTCAPDAGYILQAGDCNDGNPFTHATAAELCDREDNDCDGAAEAPGVCPSNPPVWSSTTLGDTTKDWYTVKEWGDGGFWIAGESGRRARMLPGETSFTYQDANCSANWYSLWVDEATGRLYLGGGSGKLGIQERDSSTCTVDPPAAGDSTTRGLVGRTLAGGGVEILGVGANTNITDGRAFGWDGGVANQTVTPFSGFPFLDAHGLATTPIFVVGGPLGTPRIRQHIPPSDWKEVTVPTTGTSGLNAVWVVNPKLAFAVGENRTVLQWNGQTWGKHPVTLDKAATDEALHGVIAFGGNALYVVSNKGNVFYFDGKTWEKAHTVSGKVLNDIAGTGPDNLWIVGSGGSITHWPR